MGIYLHASPLLLNSSLGIRLIDFSMHVLIAGAFEYVVVPFILSFYCQNIFICPFFSLSLYLPYSFVIHASVKKMQNGMVIQANLFI